MGDSVGEERLAVLHLAWSYVHGPVIDFKIRQSTLRGVPRWDQAGCTHASLLAGLTFDETDADLPAAVCIPLQHLR